ncbi:MAG: glycosyltransferase [Planctomycetales bacterium]|nr:glycosyltransferase [Planctomycetales bacterium]
MNKPRRVLLLTRHFWPAATDEALRLHQFAHQLRSKGIEATIATPRWHSRWPSLIWVDEFPVFRIDHPPISSLRSGKYQRSVARFVETTKHQFDLVYCDSPDLEAAAVLDRVSRLERPATVVRYDSRILQPSLLNLDVLRKADLVMADGAIAHKQLLGFGLSGPQIYRCEAQQWQELDRSAEARRIARRMLGEINHDLFVRSADRVVVCPGALSEGWCIDLLIRALCRAVDDCRSLRLWILGDGPKRGRFYEALRREGIHNLVAMPGIFSSIDEVLKAADLCVFPAPAEGYGWLVPTCLASGIPLVCADCVQARYLLGSNSDQCVVSPDDPHSLGKWIENWYYKPEPAVALAKEQQRVWLRRSDASPNLTAVWENLNSGPLQRSSGHGKLLFD